MARPTSLLLVLAAVLSVLVCQAAAAEKTGQITVFWGRHKDEGTLGDACNFSRIYTTVNMAFLNVYGHGKYHLDLSGHRLDGVGGDIRHCQSLGIPVFLSIGGFGGDYGLPTSQSAVDLADHLWYSYLGGSREGVPRPFGDAQLDGIDFFLEGGGVGERYDVLARELAKHGQPLRLTATPRRAFPDGRAFVERTLATGVFERIHVRFYDYPNCTAWIEDAWVRWTAAYPTSKVFLGLTASEKDSCYLERKAVFEIVMPIVQKADNYGGVMLWDRYSDEQNFNQYSSYVKNWV
ncbi:xylanase inhibitor protein 1-like [Lolium rigidum]|uniref:xylanase inhibitor protein 1-like n=1 Tax=Lolium rigidum TaxID=89674 RepID=UPI001F5D5A8A|nr:xylanase inhibitor protein 1-like [Lolium rigidum]